MSNSKIRNILKMITMKMEINKMKPTKYKMEINQKIKWMSFISIWTNIKRTKTRPNKTLKISTRKRIPKQMKNMTNLSIRAN